MFIEKLELYSDIGIVKNEADELIKQYGWGHTHQLCLTHRDGAANIWHDGAGSLFSKQDNTFKFKETDFCNWNLNTNSYIRNQIELLLTNNNFKLGRVRVMRLLPKIGLSVHCDKEVRYHLVLKTNRFSYIVEDMMANSDHEKVQAICYHLPQDNHWYKVDTTRHHWVYNGGSEERIHIVVSGNPK
jgi:hypothetical protein